jgi:hypothetical protein
MQRTSREWEKENNEKRLKELERKYSSGSGCLPLFILPPLIYILTLIS